MSVAIVHRARTSTLEIGYEAHGRADAPAVILLHGFPDDARSWDGVVPPLVESSYRVVVPYLRGFGPTRFLDAKAPRMAQQAAIGRDVVDLMDALRLDRAFLVGQDWGSRAACVVAALRPARVRALVAVAGYQIQDIAGAAAPGDPAQEARLWYQWYFNTERGRAGLTTNRQALCRHLWRTWSPGWRFDDATFARTAAAFDNPDFVDVVIHSYRHRHRSAPGEPRFDADEARLATQPRIEVPTLVLHGRDDTVDPVHTSEDQSHLFTGGYTRRVIDDVGHFVHRERPGAVAGEIISFLAGIP